MLRGQALRDARLWAEGKSLGDDDRRFLDASQELEKRDIQTKLVAEQEANQILTTAAEQAKQQLAVADRKVKQRTAIGVGVLAVTLGLAGLAAVGAVTANHQKTEAEKKVRVADLQLAVADVRLKNAASNELFLTGQPFKALLEGLAAADQLKQLGQSAGAEDNTRIVTTVALQQAVYGVQERNILEQHQDYVWSVSFSPDGKTLATGSVDKTVKLWEVASGREIKTLKGHQAVVWSVSFSPDGKTLATGSSDRTVKLWNLNFDLDNLIALGCDWVRLYLISNPNASASQKQACGITRKP